MGSVAKIVGNKTVEVQLHWSEYLQGTWSTRESSGFSTVISKTVSAAFQPSSVFVHVSIAYEAGDESGVYVHLAGDISRSFYLAGRNSTPENLGYCANDPQGLRPENPFSSNTKQANRYKGSGPLSVSYQEKITTEPGKTPPKANPAILQDGGGFTLLPCDNNLIALGVSEDAYKNATDPSAVKAAIESGLSEIMSLMKPVFYQDHLNTFFIEPSVTERTIEEWQEWVVTTPPLETDWRKPGWWKELPVVPTKPHSWPLPDPREGWWNPVISPEALINPKPDRDWLVNPTTVLEFDQVLIGAIGRAGLELAGGTTSALELRTPVHVNPGSELASGSRVVLADSGVLEQSGLVQATGGLNVVGKAGLNSVLASNLNNASLAGRLGAATIGH